MLIKTNLRPPANTQLLGSGGSEPKHDADDVDSRKEMPSTLVVAGSDGAEVLQPIDAALHHITPLIRSAVTLRRHSTLAPTVQPRFAGILTLWAHATNTACPQLMMIEACPIRPVKSNRGRLLAGPTAEYTWYAHRVQHWDKKRGVRRLAFRDHNRERTGLAVAQNMDFAGASPTTVTEPNGSCAASPLDHSPSMSPFFPLWQASYGHQ